MRVRWRAAATFAATVCLLLAASGCARTPGGAGGTVRLAVTVQFAGAINPNYHYFFVIRNANDPSNLNAPVAVVDVPYGNGFAADLHPAAGTAAFTDFVQFSRAQAQATSSGYAVYHVPGGISGNPNTGVFLSRGEPDYSVPPAGSNQLYFELSLSRLTPAVGSGEPDPNNGQLPRYLQANLIAVTDLPVDPQHTDPNHFVDAIGDQRLRSGSFNSFVLIDTAQVGRVYQNSPDVNDPFYEPTNDTFPGASDPGIEMIAWRVQVLGK